MTRNDGLQNNLAVLSSDVAKTIDFSDVVTLLPSKIVKWYLKGGIMVSFSKQNDIIRGLIFDENGDCIKSRKKKFDLFFYGKTFQIFFF